jgi:hypothetical protein
MTHRRPRALVAALTALGTTLAVSLVPATPAHAAGVVQVVEAESEWGLPGPTHDISATCPDGTYVYGGGGWVHVADPNSFDDVRITSLFAGHFGGSGGDYYAAIATQNVDYDGSWAVHVVALCGPPLANYHIVTAVSYPTRNNYSGSAATCPPGTQVLSSGFILAPRYEGPRTYAQFVIPSDDLAEVRNYGYLDQPITTVDWSMIAQAVCAQPPTGLTRVLAIGTTGSSVAVASCNDGYELVGVGGYLSTGAPGFGKVYIAGLYPEPGTNHAYVIGKAHADGYTRDWVPIAIAICAEFR